MMISIVLPGFNVVDYVAAAVASVQAQDHADWELVIVDDGSTDGTGERATAVPDPRIRLVRQANAGVSAARNSGLDLARGEAVLFLDGDDMLAPDALSRLAATLEAGEAVAACGAFRFVAEDGTSAAHAAARRPPGGDLLPRLLVANLFANGGHLLIRRAALLQAGRFRTGLRYGEDWEYWCRLAALGPIAPVEGPPVLLVRQRPSGAYLRLAHDEASFAPCLDAIYGAPGLAARFGATELARLRRRADAETAWIVGRELIRHGQRREGRRWLGRSLRRATSVKRLLLLLAACLPGRGVGPFQRYAHR